MLVNKNYDDNKKIRYLVKKELKKAWQPSLRGIRYGIPQQAGIFFRKKNITPFVRGERPNNCILKFEKVIYLEKITINTDVYENETLEKGIVKLLKHDFNKAEILDVDVYKGEVKFNKDEDLKILKTEDLNFDMLIQIMIPSDLYYLYLALGTLGVKTPVVDQEYKNAITKLFTDQGIEKIETITSLVKRLVKDERYVEFVKTWVGKARTEKNLAVLTSLNFYVGRRKKNLNEVVSKVDEAMSNYSENIENYSIFSRLLPQNFSTRLGRMTLKIRNPFYMMAMAMMASKSFCILYHVNSKLLPDVDLIKMARFLRIPDKNKSIRLLGVLNINVNTNLFYPLI